MPTRCLALAATACRHRLRTTCPELCNGKGALVGAFELGPNSFAQDLPARAKAYCQLSDDERDRWRHFRGDPLPCRSLSSSDPSVPSTAIVEVGSATPGPSSLPLSVPRDGMADVPSGSPNGVNVALEAVVRCLAPQFATRLNEAESVSQVRHRHAHI